MSDATYRFDVEALIRKIRADAERALAVAGEDLRNRLKVNLSGPSPSKPGNFPGADTGALSRSIYNDSAGPLRRRVGTHLPYGKTLEIGVAGGFIYPKNVKALPIPLNYRARRMLRTLNIQGGARGSLRQRNLVFLPSKKGDRSTVGILVERTKGGKPSRSAGAARFALRKSLRYVPRPWLLRTAIAERPAMLAKFRATMARSIESGVRVG